MKNNTKNVSKAVWVGVAYCAVAATTLLSCSFMYAMKGIFSSGQHYYAKTSNPINQQQVPKAQNNDIKLVALGDSLARGTGGQEGNGFLTSTAQLLQTKGYNVQVLNNLGINGLTTVQLLAKLKEKGVRYAIAQSNVLLLSIGGNDLHQTAQLDKNKKSNEVVAKKVSAELPKACKRMAYLLEQIKQINPHVKIMIVGLYNPYGALKELKHLTNKLICAWNAAVLDLTLTRDYVTLIPTFDGFKSNLSSFLAADQFHPNEVGYDFIARRIGDQFQPIK